MNAKSTTSNLVSKVRRTGTPSLPLAAMSDAEIEAGALSDPDAAPLTAERLTGLQRTPKIKTLRRALDLTQEEFAARYEIPLGTLRDWEQGRSAPDAPARAYLKAITGAPEAIRRALLSAAE